MKHWLPDRSTMQGSRFRRGPSVSSGLTWGNASRSIPRISRDQRHTAAVGCIWLPTRSGFLTGQRGAFTQVRGCFAWLCGGRGIQPQDIEDRVSQDIEDSQGVN